MPVSNGPKVHIVEDDAATRSALVSLVDSVGLQAVPYGSGRNFIDGHDRHSMGCIALDVRLPGISGLEILRTLGRRGSKLPPFVMSAYADPEMVVEAFKLGAVDFLPKPFPEQAFLNAVQWCLEIFDEQARRRQQHHEFYEKLETLTTREKQVFLHALSGTTNLQTSLSLGISVKTVEAHRASLRKKLQAPSFAQLVRIATLTDAKSVLKRND